jgi:hypothetical protein
LKPFHQPSILGFKFRDRPDQPNQLALLVAQVNQFLNLGSADECGDVLDVILRSFGKRIDSLRKRSHAQEIMRSAPGPLTA